MYKVFLTNERVECLLMTNDKTEIKCSMENQTKDHYIPLLKDQVDRLEETLAGVKKIITQLAGDTSIDFSTLVTQPAGNGIGAHDEADGQIVEGVFNGFEFIGRDGKSYSVPQNYASKSKLVEGDLLKLTISPTGSFIYKQIGPVERERLRGTLAKDPDSNTFVAVVGEHVYRLLLASVTYYDGEVGDEVVILVPRGEKVTWAAVENVIKK